MSLGFSIYTTSPPINEYKSDPHRGGNDNWTSPIWGSPKKGTYSKGSRISTSLYLGYRNGNNVSRIGVDAPWVQDFFQNGFHNIIGSPFFNADYGPPSGMFMQSGYNFPYSLYQY